MVARLTVPLPGESALNLTCKLCEKGAGLIRCSGCYAAQLVSFSRYMKKDLRLTSSLLLLKCSYCSVEHQRVRHSTQEPNSTVELIPYVFTGRLENALPQTLLQSILRPRSRIETDRHPRHRGRPARIPLDTSQPDSTSSRSQHLHDHHSWSSIPPRFPFPSSGDLGRQQRAHDKSSPPRCTPFLRQNRRCNRLGRNYAILHSPPRPRHHVRFTRTTLENFRIPQNYSFPPTFSPPRSNSWFKPLTIILDETRFPQRRSSIRSALSSSAECESGKFRGAVAWRRTTEQGGDTRRGGQSRIWVACVGWRCKC